MPVRSNAGFGAGILQDHVREPIPITRKLANDNDSRCLVMRHGARRLRGVRTELVRDSSATNHVFAAENRSTLAQIAESVAGDPTVGIAVCCEN